MTKKYRVTLTVLEREELAALPSRGKADVLKHAQVLLHGDEGEAADGSGPGWCDTRIAEAVGVGLATVLRVRQRFVEEGFAAAPSSCRTGRRVYGRKLDGAQEAHLVALACGTAPATSGKQLLTDLEGLGTTCRESVRLGTGSVPEPRSAAQAGGLVG